MSAEAKAEKAAYDAEYRRRNREQIKKKKYAWYVAHRNPGREREVRAKNRDRHRAYIAVYNADPANQAKKSEYDLNRRSEAYGAFGEAYKLLLALQDAIKTIEPSWYERAKVRGYYERSAMKRRRDAQVSRW